MFSGDMKVGVSWHQKGLNWVMVPDQDVKEDSIQDEL